MSWCWCKIWRGGEQSKSELELMIIQLYLSNLQFLALFFFKPILDNPGTWREKPCVVCSGLFNWVKGDSHFKRLLVRSEICLNCLLRWIRNWLYPVVSVVVSKIVLGLVLFIIRKVEGNVVRLTRAIYNYFIQTGSLIFTPSERTWRICLIKYLLVF